MARKFDENTENQIIDAIVAKGYSEDEVLDAIVELEADDNGTFYASDKKAERQKKKEQKKAARKAKKEEKAKAKAEKKAAKAENKEKKAGDGKGLETAERIGGLVSSLGNTVVNVSGALTNLKNSNGNAQAPVDYRTVSDTDTEEEESSKLPLILGIAGVVVVVVVIIVILKKKK